MRNRFTVLAGLLVAAPAVLQAQDLYIKNARIVDPAARTVVEGNILVRSGTIAGFPRQKPGDFEGQELDAGGRWVMPALTDMHTHSFGNASAAGAPEMLGPMGVARVDLAAGVARYLDLFSAEDAILGFRNNQRTNGLPGAEILAAGSCLTATRGHCSEYGVPTRIVDTPDDARREVTALAAKRPDVVKVVYDHQSYGGRSLPTINRPTLEPVVATAREHGLKTVVHVGTWQDIEDAVLAGAAAVTHTPSPGVVPQGLPALMAQRGVFHIPTLAVQSDFANFVADPALLDTPLLKRVASETVIASYRQAPAAENPLAGWLRRQQQTASGNLQAVATLFRAGVPMLTGTDGGNPAVFQGYSVHRELVLLVAAGLDPWDALAASTINAGRFFGRNWGMEAGAEATLLLLDGSPVDDIHNTERIQVVINKGKLAWSAPTSP